MSEEMNVVGGEQVVPLILEFEGNFFDIFPEQSFYVGREGDLIPDDNPYLHRRAFGIIYEHDLWWMVNTGSRISITVSDPKSGAHTWLTPGSRTPLIFNTTSISFTAGPCAYELVVHNRIPPWQTGFSAASVSGMTTMGAVNLTPSQKQLIVALAEPQLRREGTGAASIPSNAAASTRLGWTQTRFNRKLDNVCDKLDKLGVDGLRGSIMGHASNRRARLVEFAISIGLVTVVDLQLLDEPGGEDADECDNWFR